MQPSFSPAFAFDPSQAKADDGICRIQNCSPGRGTGSEDDVQRDDDYADRHGEIAGVQS
jgi:hypothetical protein